MTMLGQTARTVIAGDKGLPPGRPLTVGTARTGAPHADHLEVGERMIVATVGGCFAPNTRAANSTGSMVERGAVVGHIGDTEVTSPFTGIVGGQLAVAGERVRYGQPLLWLRGPA